MYDSCVKSAPLKSRRRCESRNMCSRSGSTNGTVNSRCQEMIEKRYYRLSEFALIQQYQSLVGTVLHGLRNAHSFSIQWKLPAKGLSPSVRKWTFLEPSMTHFTLKPGRDRLEVFSPTGSAQYFCRSCVWKYFICSVYLVTWIALYSLHSNWNPLRFQISTV